MNRPSNLFRYWFLIVIACLAGVQACKSYLEITAAPGGEPVYRAPESRPATEGNPEAGFQYLITGDYIGSGIPLEQFTRFLPDGYTDTVFNREAPGGQVPYTFNAFTAQNGVLVTSGNCFTCHAGKLNGKLIPGMGDGASDFTGRADRGMGIIGWGVRRNFGKQSPETEVFSAFSGWVKAMAPHIRMPMAGANPAFRLEEGCVAHRNPADLTWAESPVFEMSAFNLGADVPPLWHLKKKTTLYYNGMGRGDFRKLLMQASVLGIPDSAYARRVLSRFGDVVAWCEQLEAPAFPGPVDAGLAAQGYTLFENTCAKCHGSYGENEFYPNKIIPLKEIGTDPVYANYFLRLSGLPGWYNQSWFGQSAPKSELKPSAGYVAPPLDGIWCTAPYFHNGSVPNLEAVLNSSARPAIWHRHEKWAYQTDVPGVAWQEGKGGKDFITFDTGIPGYGNGGHTFGDTLNDTQRKALIEYLKTL